VDRKRRELFDGVPETIQEALSLLKESPRERVWYVLEGLSQSDAYLETDAAIFVIEGKRTASGCRDAIRCFAI